MREAYNAVFVEAEAAGQLMFYGRGAGGAPTASAVLGDLVAVGRNRRRRRSRAGRGAYADLPVRPMGEAVTRYYIGLDVADKAGVLAPVAQTFAAHGVSIETVRQDGARRRRRRWSIVTHEATDAALAATVDELRELDVVRAVASVMRVEGGRMTATDARTAPWRGVIEEYRDRLPVTAATPVVTPARGRHAAGAGADAVRAAPAARSTSRSRAPTRPVRSRTAA